MGRKRLQSYVALVAFLGEILGDHCEIALLDLTRGNQQISAIANSGAVSGRQPGAPITDLAMQFATSGIWKKQPYVLNYNGITSDGRNLRSSTFFITEGERLLGMLCINFSTSYYISLANAALRLAGLPAYEFPGDHQSGGITEEFTASISDRIQASIAKYTAKHYIPLERITQSERLDLIAYLHSNGIFQVKGAVSVVAAKLHCAPVTIYRDISQIEKNSGCKDAT